MILSFQGSDGGLTFPMNGVLLHWFSRLFERQAVGDIGGALQRSVKLGLMVMAATVVILVAAGMAFRRRFPGAGALFTLAVASLIVPSILVNLGIGLLFSLAGWDPDWYSSTFGAQLTWTLPFGLSGGYRDPRSPGSSAIPQGQGENASLPTLLIHFADLFFCHSAHPPCFPC